MCSFLGLKGLLEDVPKKHRKVRREIPAAMVRENGDGVCS